MKRRERGFAGRLEFQSQNLWVGIFVLGAVLLFVAGSLGAMRERLFLHEYRLNTTFTRIQGLQVGADVLLRGYRVGEVTRIDLTTEPDVRFQVEFSVQNAVRLPMGSQVRLTTRGFGNKVLDIVTPGDPAVPDAPPPVGPGAPAGFLSEDDFLPSDRGSDMDALLGDLVLLTRRLSGTVERIDTLVEEGIAPALRTVAGVLQEDVGAAARDLRATSASARELSGLIQEAVEENRPKASRMLDLAGEELEAVGELTRTSERFLEDLSARLDPFFAELTATLERTDAILSEADAAADEAQLRRITADLETVAEQGALLMEELRRRPWRLLRRTRKEKKNLIRELEAREEAAREPHPEEPPP